MGFEAALLRRLQRLLGDRDLGNGTRLANATAVAIAADARTAGVDAGDVRRLPDDALLAAADEIYGRVNGKWIGDALPFGTRMIGTRTLSIGGRAWVADAGRPGLHPVETTRPEVHGLNLERLLALIAVRIRGKPWRAIPLPTPLSVRATGLRRHLQFPPFAAAGGVVLQHPISRRGDVHFCALTFHDLETLAKEVAKAMAKLWAQRSRIADQVEIFRREIESLLFSAHGPLPPVSIRFLACAFQNEFRRTCKNPLFSVEYNSLDNALRPNAVYQSIDWSTQQEEDDSDRFFTPEVQDEWNARSRRKADLLSQGAVGDMDELTAAIIRAAPEGEQGVLDRLSQNLETSVTLPCGRSYIHVVLTWLNGRVTSVIHNDLIRAADGVLEIRASLPQSVMAAAVGRPMSRLIKLPFAFDAAIKTIQEIDKGWLRVTFSQKWLIDADTGALRPR